MVVFKMQNIIFEKMDKKEGYAINSNVKVMALLWCLMVRDIIVFYKIL